MLRTFSFSLFPYSLYTHAFALILVIWDYFSVRRCVATRGAFDRALNRDRHLR